MQTDDGSLRRLAEDERLPDVNAGAAFLERITDAMARGRRLLPAGRAPEQARRTRRPRPRRRLASRSRARNR